jgi:hypothetical protein
MKSSAPFSLSAIGAALAALLVASLTAVPATASEPVGCSDPGGRDYSRPLSKLPSLRSTPADGRLPFGPSGILFDASGPEILVPGNVGGSEVGFSFSTAPGIERSFNLDWHVTSRLMEVSSRGQIIREVDKGSLSVGRTSADALRKTGLRLSVGMRPALYRFDVHFETDNGKSLARYGRYLRVMAGTDDARLDLVSANIHPGEEVWFRVENLGTREVYFDAYLQIDQYTSSGWSPAPIPSHGRIKKLFGIDPGGVGVCQSEAMPSDLPIGQYRLRKDILVNLDPAGKVRRRTLVAEFQVEH